jgi:hypothetical protein
METPLVYVIMIIDGLENFIEEVLNSKNSKYHAAMGLANISHRYRVS